MKTGKVAGVLACLCLGLLTACQQTKEGNPISSLPGPIIPVQNPNTEPGGTGVGLPSTPPSGSVPPGQPSPLVPPPVSAPTIPPLPTPNPSPSIVGLPPGPLAAPTFTKSFSPSTTSAGVPVTLSFSITNNSGIQLTGLSFTDSLPAGLLVANPSNLTNTCGGTPSAPPGGALITLSGGTLAANATCAVTVQVVAAGTGTYTNPAVTLTSDQAPAVQSAPVNLSVNPVTAPAFAKSFSPSTTSVGVPVTLSFTITNNSGIELTGLNFADNLPTGLLVANPSNLTNTCGGTPSAPPGGALITLSGGTLAANATCTVTVQVVASAPGTYTNPPVTLTSAQAPAVQSAPVNLSVNPVTAPAFAKSFSPSTTSVGVPVTLSFTITNNSGIELTGLNFADNLPTGLLVANPSNLTNTCGGTASAPPGGALITLSGGTLAANATCTVTVQVVASAPGTYTNPPVTLTSAQAPAVQSAPVNLSVNPVTAPAFTKQFNPSSTQNGSTVAVVFTITNNALVPLSGLSFIDALPGGLRITTPVVTLNTCGGTLTAPAGGTTISLAGGSLAAGAYCVVSVSVEQVPPPPPPPVTYDNPPVTLFSSEAPPATSGLATVTFTP